MADSLFPHMPPQPVRRGPNESEAKRWAKLVNRCGFKAEVVTQKPGDKVFYGIRITRGEGEKSSFRDIGTVISWQNWLDSELYHKSEGAILWDHYLPSESPFKEKEIHKWIKEYKEVD